MNCEIIFYISGKIGCDLIIFINYLMKLNKWPGLDTQLF